MRRHLLIIALAGACSLCTFLGCDKPGGKSNAKSNGTSHTAADSLTPNERAILGTWQLDRNASTDAKLATATLPGGLAYEFRADGTGFRRVGKSPVDAITWKTVEDSGDGIKIIVTEDRPSGTPNAVQIAVEGPTRLGITDRLGQSILQRTDNDVALAQPDLAPEVETMSPAFSIDTTGTGMRLAADRDGRSLIVRIASAAQRNFLRYEMTSRTPAFAVSLAPSAHPLPVAEKADGRYCATADVNGVILWDTRNGTQVRSFAPRPGEGGTPVALTFAHDKDLIVMAGGRYVIGWNLTSGDEEFSLRVDDSELSAMALFPNDKYVATAGSDGKVKIWNLADSLLFKQLDPGETNPATALAVSDDGYRLASAHMLGKIVVFNLPVGGVLRTIDPHHPRIDSMRFMPDNRTLIHPVHATTWDIALTDVETGEERLLLKGHASSPSSLALADQGNTLFSAADDQTIKVWDLTKVNRP